MSSQSPLKRMDPATEQGRDQLQEIVDTMAAQFIAEVAAYRAVTAEHVMAKFGRGGVLVARSAVAAGMADETGTYEGVIARLNATQGAAGVVSIAAGATAMTTGAEEEKPMAEETQPNEQEITARVKARIRAITGCAEATGREALASGS